MTIKTNIKYWVATISRTLLGLVFIFSGFVKAVDPLGTVYKIEDYLKAFGGFFIDLLPLATIAAVSMIALEFVLGVCMTLNVRTRWTAWVALVFYCVMTPLTLYIAIKDPVSDCGCFGDAIVISNWQTFWKNVILLTLAILLVIWRKHIHSLWNWVVELGWASIALLSVGGLMWYTYLHLPIIDFRPFKIGNHLPSLMIIPEGAEQDVYETIFIYSKDGVEKEFTLENYPKDDDSWTFVRQESKLIKKGYEPPIHDFVITDSQGEDITQKILTSTEPVTLIIMYDLSKSNMDYMDKVEALYESCMEHGQECYIVTGSSSESIEEFGNAHPILKSHICSCDGVTLKTIVRANPGVIVLQNGTVIDKANMRNYEYIHQSVQDASLFKKGNNLVALMEIPADAPQDEYIDIFYYTKDGVEKGFTLENYPKGDTTWTFVRRDIQLLKKGYVPPLQGLEIINVYGDDITWDIVYSIDPVTLIIMPDLTAYTPNQMNKIQELYQSCYNKEQMCYIITSIESKHLTDFQKKYPQLEEAICTCDPNSLKSMTHATPGVIVVADGIITDKYYINNK
jgi:uncharacterized membrane protein YphA (DoxX/SURF4 family)